MTGVWLLILALLQWLFFWSRFAFRRDARSGENAFLVSTVVLALAWTAQSAVWNASRPEKGSPVVRKRSCSAIHEEMTIAELRATLGSPSRTVPEHDTRGPGAEAWVYDSARCVAHVLGDQVRSVDYE